MSNRAARIQVEFYGVTRARTGLAEFIVDIPAGEATLGTLFQRLQNRFPTLKDCFDGPRLANGLTANIGGQRFVTSSAEPLRDGDVVLLMSADPGG